MLIKKRTKNIKVEIIVLTFNELATTKDFISTLYKNTSDFGLTILDNGSKDGTREFLIELANDKENITLYTSEENLGVIVGRNRAYEISQESSFSPDYVIFLDYDQFVQKGWLGVHLKELGDFDIIGVEAWKMKKDFFPFRKITSSSDSFNYIGCGGMIIKKNVIEDIGLFDERYSPMYFEDPDFCWRAHNKNYSITWNVHPIIKHMPHKLLNGERRNYFKNSWKKFSKKWSGYKMPEFKVDNNG